MNTRYEKACLLSVFLHGAAIALVLFFAFWSNQANRDQPKIFELVAGEGDNYAATVAPALGSPDVIKANLPPAPAASPTPPAPLEPTPAPEAPAPETARVVPAPTATPTAHPAKAKPAPVLNLKRTVQRSIAHRAWVLERKYRKELEAEQRKRMSYEQYLKEHGGKLPSNARAARLQAEGIAGGVVGGSTANKVGGAHGRALTREESSLLDAYFALLKARVRENFVAPADVSDKLMARITFYLAADGSISQVRIATSSGNGDFDQAVLEAFRHTRSIGPRPDGRGEEMRLWFSMREDDTE